MIEYFVKDLQKLEVAGSDLEKSYFIFIQMQVWNACSKMVLMQYVQYIQITG